jgi:GTP-binding protein LepA
VQAAASIDHGKSATLRTVGATQTVTAREEKAQCFRQYGLRAERGITIKSHAIQMEYTYKGQDLELD